jgi:hypothetical protein
MIDKNGREIQIGDVVRRLKEIWSPENPHVDESVSTWGTGRVSTFVSSTCLVCNDAFGRYAVLASTLEVVA